MRGFILAASFGTRLRPITEHIPKALVSVCGDPLLKHSLRYLQKQGISEIGVNAHYLTEQIDQYSKTSKIPFNLFREESKIRGTGGAFYFARDFLAQDDSFLAINVDIVCNADIGNVIRMFEKSSSICGLIAFPANEGEGTVLYDSRNGEYLGVPSKINRSKDSADASFIGAALYKKEILNFLKPDDFSIVPVWSRVKEKGFSVTVYVLNNGYWRDVGTPESLARIHFDAIENKIQFDNSFEMVIDEQRKVCIPECGLPNILGSLGTHVWVEESNLPYGCYIDRSVIFKGARIEENARIVDSLVTPWGAVSFK